MSTSSCESAARLYNIRVNADDAVRALDEQFRAVSLTTFMPPVLYHYTSAEGLLGIVESGILRAGNFSYVNDASELTYGQELVTDVLSEEIGDAPTSLLRTLSVRLQTQAGRRDPTLS